jgi:hypothetical protein
MASPVTAFEGRHAITRERQLNAETPIDLSHRLARNRTRREGLEEDSARHDAAQDTVLVLEALLVRARVRLEVLFEQAVERGALGVFG